MGCGGGASPAGDPSPPSNLTYTTNPATYIKDVAIAPNTPTSGGGPVVSYSVSPSLPAGLSLNGSTGVISGTPTVVTALATYTVTASNTGGSTSADLAITVNAAPTPGVFDPGIVVIDATTPPDPGPLDLNADPDLDGKTYVGGGYNTLGVTTAFRVDLEITLTATTAGSPPDRVELACSPRDCRPGSATLSESTITGTSPVFRAQILDVDLEVSAPDAVRETTLVVTAWCGASACGQRTYGGIFADPVPPTYQFDRCSLCRLAVPYAGAPAAPACAGCAGQNADTSADITGPAAVWNRAGDQDLGTAATFSITASRPLTLLVRGLDDGQDVALDSSQPANISGNVLASVFGCTSSVTSCALDFAALEVGSLSSNSARHVLTPSFTDKAGNHAIPDALRCAGATCSADDEAIIALVDTVPPEGVATTACIGESTIPPGPSQPRTAEDPSCATYCTGRACSRTRGQVVLRWLAPHDDGASDPGVAALDHYELLVAALGIPYGGNPALTACNEVVPGATVEQVVIPTLTPGPPGAEVIAQVDGLYPHRDYCFAVVGVDDAGNRAVLTGGDQAERVLPLLTDVPGLAGPLPPALIPFDPLAPVDDQDAAIFYGPAHYAPPTSSGFGQRVFAIGDLDRDGREDFAVQANGRRDVFLFLSKRIQAGWSATNPVQISSNANDATFGVSMAHGRFNEDAFDDLAICSPGVNGGEGAVYLYYGKADIGIDTSLTNVDARLPNVTPDVAILAAKPTGQEYFCKTVALANVDGRPGDDLIVGDLGGLGHHVYGFSGGHSNRFPASAPAIYTMAYAGEEVAVGSGWDPSTPSTLPTNPERPDLVLMPTSYPGDFPFDLTTGDFNGDGKMDLAVSQPGVDHGVLDDPACLGTGSPNSARAGEVYVYAGGTSLTGTVAGPDATPPQLMHLLRYTCAAARFGDTLGTIPAPRPGDGADWLYARAGNAVGLMYKGTDVSFAGIVPRDSAIDPRIYPVGGPSTDWILDATLWDGTAATRFGARLAILGELDGLPGVDIALAPRAATAGSNEVFIYSYSAVNEAAGGSGFVRRAILDGGPNSPADGYGWDVAGAWNYAGLGPQLVVSRSLGLASSDGPIFIYR